MAMARHPKATFFVQRQLFAGLTSFAELESKIAALPDEQSRGAAFEVFAEAYLATQRKYDAAQVWPHGSVPLDILKNLGLSQQDRGVDGVLQTLLGQFNAYQIKFRTGRPSLTWRELSTFFGLTDSPRIYNRIVFTNCDAFPDDLKDRRGFFCIRGSDLDRLEADDFRAIEAWLADAVFITPKKSPDKDHKHQAEALDALVPALQSKPCVTAIMACGTGKTLVALLGIPVSRLVTTRGSVTLRDSFVDIAKEIQRRRTFAIISHPDAGKTTLTEKLLLYGGAVQLAGSVTARKNQRATTSDWMELEKKRGISISSTVLQFDYDGYRLNLLDTPGHKDFSEDTYRVLTAVDSVVMVIDSAKGIEPQTRKLFEVCRQRGVPIFTFMNKCDRPMKDPLALLDELERVLGIGAFPVNWPIGSGADFRGVYDRQTKLMHLFERTVGGKYRAPVSVGNLHDPEVRGQLDDATFNRTVEELEMLEIAGHDWDDAAVLTEKTTPVFFGSASNNFGVQLLLDGFLKHSPAPKSRVMGGIEIAPENPAFSGFIFKIQANMDPRHRDRIAFIRVCSGKFDRDMTVHHSRSEKKVRLSSSHKLFGNERETVDEAYPGDVIGLVGHDSFGIGDTLTTDPKILYKEIPRFTPEAFSYLHNPNTGKYKQFRQGLDQLLQEGVIQALYLRNSSIKTPLLAAVGPLQFEVVQFRLESEYGAESRLEAAPWSVVRWLPTDIKEEELDALSLPTGSRLAYDLGKNPVVLFQNEWSANYFGETNKNTPLSTVPVQTAKE